MTPTRRAPFASIATVLCFVAALTATTAQAASFTEFIDPHPAPGNGFGNIVVPLSTGNVVITSPYDDFGGSNAGAVYLFNGATGALISMLHGSTDGDQIGAGVTALTNGNFVIASPQWDNGAIGDAGAVTWASGTIGVSGTISAANSLVGSGNDEVGIAPVIALPNGNYVVPIPGWDNGANINAGAVTWGSGTTGVSGPVSAANSLVGTAAGDVIANRGVIVLANGNYVVCSSLWDSGGNSDVGAVTWGSGTTGASGVVSAANSLVGSTAFDHVGDIAVTALTNGNYVVDVPEWDNGAIADVGAATWCNGTTGRSGTISASNSLVGSIAVDRVGHNGVTALTNGNYVVASTVWDNGSISNAGAVTWGDGTSGTTGTLSAANSLVGAKANDSFGTVTALTNGNYMVRCPTCDNGSIVNAGALAWGNGTMGVSGTLSAANSLVGMTTNDFMGCHVTPLPNGNYVVWCPNWDNGAIIDAGAVSWRSGTTGVSGTFSAANSLVGSAAFDQVGFGGVTALTNGNYVVLSPLWDNGAAVDGGAATWASGTSGMTGTISSSNSLVGAASNDVVGNAGVTPLTNGNYVVQSQSWHVATNEVGAVTWCNGTTGTFGNVLAANSLVGSTGGDSYYGSVLALPNGNYVVTNPNWDNGAAADAGAVTWGSGTTGVSGTVTAANSLVGSTDGDQVGWYVNLLSYDRYVVASPYWDNGGLADAGAATLEIGSVGTSGVVSPGNSLVGSAANSNMGGANDDRVNGTYIIPFLTEDGGRVRVASAGTVSVLPPHLAGRRLSLEGPQPNPARSEFRYAVTLPEAMRVRVALYDVAGRRVRQLVDRTLSAGEHRLEWSRGSAVPGAGLYFLRLEGGGSSAVRPVVVLE